jgi:hypothetical protein
LDASTAVSESSQSESSIVTVELHLTAPRTALCLTNDHVEITHKSPAPSDRSRGQLNSKTDDKTQQSNSGSTLLTIAFYGFSITFGRVQHNDQSLLVRVGNICAYGVRGQSIVTCGPLDNDYWLQSGAIEGAEDSSLALNSSLQWAAVGEDAGRAANSMTSESEDESGLSSASANALKRLIDGVKTHVVVAVSIAAVKMWWDESTVMFVRSLERKFSHIDEFRFQNRSFFNREKILCASLSMHKSSLLGLESVVKLSAEMMIHGIIFECPCNVSLLHSSRDGLSKTNLSTPHSKKAEKNVSRRQSVRISMRSFKLCGGDFLPVTQAQVQLEESLRQVPTRSMWPFVNELTEVLLGKLKCSAVSPFLISCNDIEVHHISLTPTPASGKVLNSPGNAADTSSWHESVVFVTRTPWSIRAVVSPCNVQAHPIFPALRLDLYCSPLSITFSLEV